MADLSGNKRRWKVMLIGLLQHGWQKRSTENIGFVARLKESIGD